MLVIVLVALVDTDVDTVVLIEVDRLVVILLVSDVVCVKVKVDV